MNRPPACVFANAREAVERCVRVRETVDPDPAWAAAYDAEYARYRALYPALAAWRDGIGSAP